MPCLTAPELCDSCKAPGVLMARGNDWKCLDCYSKKPATVYEIQARTKKVFAVTSLLAENGITPDVLRGAPEKFWHTAAELAKVSPLSVETKLLVIQSLEAMKG